MRRIDTNNMNFDDFNFNKELPIFSHISGLNEFFYATITSVLNNQTYSNTSQIQFIIKKITDFLNILKENNVIITNIGSILDTNSILKTKIISAKKNIKKENDNKTFLQKIGFSKSEKVVTLNKNILEYKTELNSNMELMKSQMLKLNVFFNKFLTDKKYYETTVSNVGILNELMISVRNRFKLDLINTYKEEEIFILLKISNNNTLKKILQKLKAYIEDLTNPTNTLSKNILEKMYFIVAYLNLSDSFNTHLDNYVKEKNLKNIKVDRLFEMTDFFYVEQKL